MVRKRFSSGFIAFLQAFALVVYCGLVGLVFSQGNKWFGVMHRFLGPVLFLILFVVSVLISALLVLGYPIILFWEKKKRVEALKLVICTTGWLVFFILLVVAFTIIY